MVSLAGGNDVEPVTENTPAWRPKFDRLIASGREMGVALLQQGVQAGSQDW